MQYLVWGVCMKLDLILNWAQRFLNLRKICWNWNRKVLQWEEPSSNPHQRASITKKTKKIKIKSKLTLKVLFKRKLHITHACILERWNAIHWLHTMVDIENFLYGFYLYPEIKLVHRSWKKEKTLTILVMLVWNYKPSSFHVLILPQSCKIRLSMIHGF